MAWIPYGNTLNYYQSVVETLGRERAQQHVRLFLVPGMSHCRGGNGVSDIDWLSAMERWAEQDVAPEVLTGRNPGSQTRPSFSRPVCAFPQTATYDGDGDVRLAENFYCVAGNNRTTPDEESQQ